METASITPSLAGRVWLKPIDHPGLNLEVDPADYGDVAHADRSGVFPISGASLPTAVTELPGGRDHTLAVTTRDQDTEDKLKLLLRVGGIVFVHVPATPPAGLDGNRLLPGSMYALVRGQQVHRLGGVSDYQQFALPLVEVRKPDADVVGSTLTWATVERLYGSWEAVIGAHPDWASIVATVGDPEDLVVL